MVGFIPYSRVGPFVDLSRAKAAIREVISIFNPILESYKVWGCTGRPSGGMIPECPAYRRRQARGDSYEARLTLLEDEWKANAKAICEGSAR
jgi:hypothetical protein